MAGGSRPVPTDFTGKTSYSSHLQHVWLTESSAFTLRAGHV